MPENLPEAKIVIKPGAGCEEIRPYLQRFAQGGAGDMLVGSRAVLIEHLVSCPECRKEYDKHIKQ